MILCDTNIFISAFNNRKDTIARMKEIGHENIVVSSTTLMELYQGMSNKEELAKMRKNLKFYDVIHITPEVSAKVLELLHDFHLSHNLQIPDAIIAASSVVYRIPLFTYNIKDFRFVPDIVLV